LEQTRVIKFCFVDKILFDLFCWRKLKQFNDLFLFSCLLVCAVDGYGHDNILMARITSSKHVSHSRQLPWTRSDSNFYLTCDPRA
jgi:hypothetical protein